MSLHAIFFILYYVVSCVVALVAPIVGVVCYLVVYHVYPETTWWGHELTPLHIRYSLLIAVATGIGFVANAHKHATLRPYISLFEVLRVLMLANIWLTPLIGAGWLRWTPVQLDKMTKVFIFLFLLILLESLLKVLHAGFAGSYRLGNMVIRLYLTGHACFFIKIGFYINETFPYLTDISLRFCNINFYCFLLMRPER